MENRQRFWKVHCRFSLFVQRRGLFFGRKHFEGEKERNTLSEREGAKCTLSQRSPWFCQLASHFERERERERERCALSEREREREREHFHFSDSTLNTLKVNTLRERALWLEGVQFESSFFRKFQGVLWNTHSLFKHKAQRSLSWNFFYHFQHSTLTLNKPSPHVHYLGTYLVGFVSHCT